MTFKIKLSKIIALENISIKLAGDSGDGIQLTGENLSRISAIIGNNVNTIANYPSEIRSPASSLSGISGYNIIIGLKSLLQLSYKIDLLIALNPSALKLNLYNVKRGGMVLINISNFTKKKLQKSKFIK